MRRLRQQRIFNYGLRNTQAANVAESYRIISGSDTQLTMKASDARLYRQGHVFLTGEAGGDRVTIGYSAGSKVWSAEQKRIPALIKWCRSLACEIRDPSQVVTHTGLDLLPTGTVVTEIPPDIVLVQWSPEAFAPDNPARVEYVDNSGHTQRRLLTDIDLIIDRDRSTSAVLRLVVQGPGLSAAITFSLSDEVAEFFTAGDDGIVDQVFVVHDAAPASLTEYLNVAYPSMFTASGGALVGNELTQADVEASPIEDKQITVWDWTGVDIEREVEDSEAGRCVHHRVKNELRKGTADVVFVDHGAGEIADCVEVRRDGAGILFGLYHCKASCDPKPGARVKDVYEVCGQAAKSVPWLSLPRIRRRLDGRISSLEFVRGDAALLETLLEE